MLHRNPLVAVSAAACVMMLSGCATGFPAQVSRFQALPSPQGQSFVVQAVDEDNRGGLEFAQYAALVRRALIGQGYVEARSATDATLVVSLDYGVDTGRERVVSTPGGFGFGYRRPFYSRFGYFGRSRHPFYYGWRDPFDDDFGTDIRSQTVYRSFVDVDIRRAADGQAVFEGLAQAQSRTNELQLLVPNLVEALFTGFPGNSGETVRITVPDAPRR